MLVNLDNYQWSPTFLGFNSDPDQTARSTSWHVYDVCPSHSRLILHHNTNKHSSFLTPT
jgi:alpha-N-arabinofuranosidase